MKSENFLLAFVILLLGGCGTYSPIPSHGGGKRFAVEQELVSASMRKVISEIPVEKLKNKKVLFETTIVNDEGGGYISGGRPYLNEIVAAQKSKITNAGEYQSALGINASRGDSLYVKDFNFNNSDGKQFTNLLASFLARNNIMLNPIAETDGEADYFLEVIVDVLGSWRSRTDWLLSNKESLKASVSIEYIITPFGGEGETRLVGRIGYESTYTEKYLFWIGPVESEMKILRTEPAGIISDFGPGTSEYSNLKRGKPLDNKPADPAQPIMISPRVK